MSNAIARGRVAQHAAGGTALGALGVLGFSFSFPATRLAVHGGIDPLIVSMGRATVAALLGAVILWRSRGGPGPREVWQRCGRSLVLVAGGVVIGFPLLSSLALEHRTSAHGAVVIGVVPAATAIFAVLRAGERPSPGFWVASAAGFAAVVAFAISAGAGDLRLSDLELLAAVVVVGLGYTEGAVAARTLGGVRTICWGLLVALPVTLPVTVVSVITTPPAHAGADAWLGLAYVAIVSMLLAFFPWYAGLARGGVARVGQVQLAQPVLTLVWSALLLGEPVSGAMLATATVVVACVAATQRARVGSTDRVPPCPSAPPRPASPTPR